MHNIVTVTFKDSNTATANGVRQWDYGQILRIQGLQLPTAVEVHFALIDSKDSVTRIGTTKDGVTDVVIPDSMIEAGKNIFAYVYLRDSESGQTEYEIKIVVTTRAKPEAFDTPEDKELFAQAIEAVNEAADRAEKAGQAATEAAGQAAEDAQQTAEDRKEVAKMVETVSDISEQVKKVEELSNKVQEAATKTGQDAQQTAEDRVEVGKMLENVKDISEQVKSVDESVRKAKESEQAAAGHRTAVEEMKNSVEQTASTFPQKVQEGVQAIENAGASEVQEITQAGTAQKTAVEAAGTQAVESVENVQQVATEAVETAKTAAVQEVQAEGVKQAEVLQGAVQEIVEDREQIQANKESIDNIKKDLESKEAAITLDHFDLISSLHAQDGLLSGYTPDFDADISSSKSEYVVYSIHLTTAGLDNLSCKTPGAANIGNALYYTDFTNKSKEIVSAKNLNENFSNNYVTHASGEDNFEIDIAKLIKNGYKKLYICYNKTDNGYIYSSNMKPKWLYDFSADIEKLKESILGDESGTALVIRKVKSPSIYTVIHNQSSTALENGKTYFVSVTIDSDVSNGKITLNSSGSSSSVVYILAEGAINKGTHNYMFTHDSSQYNELYVRIFLDGNSEKCSLLEIIDPAGNSVEKQISRKADYMYCTVSIFNSVGAIGDSYTAGSTKHSDSTWTAEREHSYIATMAKRAGISWSNYGVPGAHTRSYLTAADGMKKVLATSANDFYFLALGINDVNALGLSYLGNEDDISSGADTFFGNYAKIINQLKGHAPNAKLCMIKPPFKDGDYPQFRDAVEKIAKHYDIPFIDPFNDPAFTNVIYTTMSDGHPTLAGYNAMGLAYERLFSKMVEDNVEYFRYATVG